MRTNTAANFFMFSPLQEGFYQHLLNGVLSFERLGNRLIKLAEHAQAFRQYDKVKELAEMLVNLPVKEYQTIGQYHLAMCGYRNMGNAKQLFEHVAEQGPLHYRARALQSLAAIEGRNKDHAAELQWSIESIKVQPSLEALRGVAVIKAKEGFHKQALKDLENLYPLARYAEPDRYFDFLNSYAVELSETGRLQEAQNVSRLVISSPFAPYYNEWQETFSEINQKLHKNHSTVVVPSLPAKPRKKRQTTKKQHAEKPTEQAKILSFPQQELREVAAPGVTYTHREEIERIDRCVDEIIKMGPVEMLAAILRIVLKDRITDREVQIICDVFYDD